jgi:Arylsulfotransferase (ASST)/Concanavalin A-like lectin/glucanases superfamily/Carbohydrate binding domain
MHGSSARRWLVPSLCLILLSVIISARADITYGLVAYYNFENLAGVVGETIVDQSGHGHNGVCHQDQSTLKAPTIVPGPSGLGSALSFDGGFYVQIPNHTDFNLTSNITVAAWVSVDAFDQDWQTMFCRGDWSWRLHRSGASDYAAFHMNGLSNGWGADGQTTNIRLPKRWLHLVGTYQNGAGACLYINGVLETSNTGLSGLINTSGNDPVTIGAQIDNGTLRRLWRGQIDDVRLYNRALGAADVSELYSFTLTGFNAWPALTLPTDQTLSAPTNLQLTATVSDDGNPLPTNPSNPAPNDPHKLRWNWSVVSVPSTSSGVVWAGNPTNGEAFTYQGSPNPPGTVFTCNPTARFDTGGVYVLKFSASDGEKASNQNMTVWVRGGSDYRSLGYLYLSPVPGAEYTSPQTRFVLVRFSSISPTAVTNLSTFIQVTGTQSGAHSGQTRIAGDGRTVMYQMSSDFIAGETATASLAPGVPTAAGGPLQAYQYEFVVSGHFPGAPMVPAVVSVPSASLANGPAVGPRTLTLAASKGVAGLMPNGVSVPSDFPWITITVSNNPDPDPIFIDNRGGGGKPYNVIFDNGGSPLWYMRMPDERRDMKVQHNGVLTMLARDQGGNHFNGFNTNYQPIAQYWTTNGYTGDEHELQVLADGTYLLIGLRDNTVDMSRYVTGGSITATVTEQVIQQFTPAGDLIFQWRAWDHLNVLDQQQFINLLGGSFDFPHMNAIEIDTDGHILLSARNTSEITKINRDNGDIIWRLGGAHNQFTFVNDPLQGPRNQHAVRTVATNRYTLFDNGNLHSPSMSRAVEYALDPTNLTATVMWQYPNPATSSIYSYYMGNAQRLTNGNTLINWALGGMPKLTEVRPDGTKAFEMNWADQWEAYRTWRCPWQGSALQPYLIVESYPDNITITFNQFGDTNVGFYKIYGSTTSQSTNILATSGVTLKRLSNLQNGSTYYFRVTAVNKQGVEGPYSNEASTTVNLIKPGQNMISNGDFLQGTASWVWTLSGGATAAWAIESGVSHVYITNGTSTLANIQLKQTGKAVIQGKKYVFEFDGWAAAPRYIEAKVAQDAAPIQNYSGTTSTYLTPVHNHYRYVFTMAAASDFNASVFFNLGSSSSGVYLDNVSLFNAPPGDINLDGQVDLLDLQLLSRDWLKQQGGLSTDLDTSGKVDFKDFGILGDDWWGGN